MFSRSRDSLLWLVAGFLAGAGMSAALADREPTRAIYVVDFMKVRPGGESEYLELERGPWKAVHEERIRRGHMRRWELYEVRYPQGMERSYDYVTVNVYDSFADAERDPISIFDSVHPGLSSEALLEKTLAVRDLVRGELWYRLDFADQSTLGNPPD